MLFKFLQKKLTVHAIISEEFSHAYEFAPIQSANKFFPEWWKRSDKGSIDWQDVNLKQSIKNCQGIQDHYSHGMIMPMWTELAVVTDGRGGIVNQFSDRISVNDYQDVSLRAGFRSNKINLKIQSPWRFTSERDVYFHMLPVYWDQLTEPSWEVMPGTLEFYYNHATNINMLIRAEQGNTMIKHGQPMCHIVPLTERPLEIKLEMVSNREFDLVRNRTRALSFINKYKTLRQAQRKQDEQKSKCPFSRTK